jgi:NAD(P)-dependent dehydrogenase (short-subunit alcohol dehydrogenase family)
MLKLLKEVEAYGKKCTLIKGDLGNENHCKKVIKETIKAHQKIDILVNNAALHWESESIEDITTDQLTKTFQNNFFSYFWTTKYAMPYLEKGASIINTTSVTAYREVLSSLITLRQKVPSLPLPEAFLPISLIKESV